MAACFKAPSRHLPGVTEENHKNLSHGNRCQGRYTNRASPEHKDGDITSAILYGVLFLVNILLEEGLSITLC